MINLINSIVDRDFVSADSILEETVELIMAKKLEEAKKMTAAKMCEQGHVMNRTAAQLTRLGVVEEEEEAGEESSMARSELNAITKDAKSIMAKVKGNKELEAWTQSKITKAADYLNSVADYMDEAIDPTEIHNGPAPTGQRVNQAGKGDKESPNTTVVPKNNLKEEDKKIDMTNKTCTKCHKGKYHETSQHDDMYGVLHCTKCGTQVKRWKVIKEDLDEEQLDEARIKLVKARIRGGKIQRRKKVSNVPGMTIRGGKLQRMSPAERGRRKMGARKAVRKRAPKMSRALMKRKRSLMKRRALGI